MDGGYKPSQIIIIIWNKRNNEKLGAENTKDACHVWKGRGNYAIVSGKWRTNTTSVGPFHRENTESKREESYVIDLV
jgi:hypothetical protein